MKKIFAAVTVIAMLCSNAARAEGNVVVSVRPLHSLVAGVMEGDERTPLLLVDGSTSVHTFALRPSQMQELAGADIVFYMGDSFEMFLGKVLNTLPSSIHSSRMESAPGVTLLRMRTGIHDEHGEEYHHEEGAYDLHLWLSPSNAKAMVAEIAHKLSALYPDRATLYQSNAEKLNSRIDTLDSELQTRLSPLADKPFVVFHDAYQYFEKAYRLRVMESVTLSPERAPGARHLSEVRKKIVGVGAICVFREPEFDGKVVDNLLEGLSVKSGVLDPEGALLQSGPELYFQLMEAIAGSLEQCLTS